ncbi:MAG: CSLREA domain-containing protein, partial [Verrucomicrobiota bacterium]
MIRCLFGIGVALLLIHPADSGLALTYTVTTTNDVLNPADGVLSLREAVIAANSNAGPDVIQLPAGIYTLSIAGSSDDRSFSGDLDITNSVTVAGAGPSNSIIDGAQLDRIFHVHRGTTNRLSGLTLRNGLAGQAFNYLLAGGGLLNEGVTVCSNLHFLGNRTRSLLSHLTMNPIAGGNGGAIYNARSLVLAGSLVESNVCAVGGTPFVSGVGGSGGGLFNRQGGSMRLYDTVIRANRAGDSGLDVIG